MAIWEMEIGQAKPKGSLATSLSFPSSSNSTRILGRKRVAVSPARSPSGGPRSPAPPLRKQRSTRLHMDDTISLLESLPQDVLVRVLCKVNHGDLRQLLLVSKPVSEATVVARELHFAFATPSSKPAFQGGVGVGEEEEEEPEGPGAPRQRRVAGRLRGRNLASIAVNLSASFDSLVSEV